MGRRHTKGPTPYANKGSRPTIIIYKAHLKTRKFAFEAFGASEPEAREALQRGLRQHEQQCGLRAGQMDEFFAVFVQITPMEFGACYCDGRRL